MKRFLGYVILALSTLLCANVCHAQVVGGGGGDSFWSAGFGGIHYDRGEVVVAGTSAHPYAFCTRVKGALGTANNAQYCIGFDYVAGVGLTATGL